MSAAGTESQFIGIGGGEGGAKAPEQTDNLSNLEANDSKIVLEGDGDDGTNTSDDSGGSTSDKVSNVPAFSDFLNRNLDSDEIALKEKETEAKLLDVSKDKSNPVSAPKDKAQPTNQTPTAKDYTGIEDTHKPLFAKMSNEAFAFAKKQYLENKELKQKVSSKESGELPESYYEHELGYTLDKGYQVLQTRTQIAGTIEDHYAAQIANIESGEKWTKILAINPDGSFKYTDEQEPSLEAKKMMVREHIAASKQSRAEEMRLDSYVSNFKNKHSENVGTIKTIKDTFFKGYDDEKHPAQVLRKEIIQGLPPAYQNHPLADLIAYAAYNNAVLLNEVKNLRAGKGKAVNGSQQSPTNKNFTGTTNTNGARVPNFSDFKARLDR